MTEAGGQAARRDPYGWWVLLLFTGGWVFVLVVINLGVAGALLFEHRDALTDPDRLSGFIEELKSGRVPGWVLAMSMLLQFPMMLALAEFVRRVAHRQLAADRNAPLPPAADAYALTWPGGLAAAIGAALGLTTGWLPGVIAAWLREVVPGLSLGTLDLVHTAFAEGSVATRALLAFGIAGLAPVVEEFVFRGLMWDALRRTVSARATWILTSVIFAAYHMDPIQASALLFTALVLGWVRLRTGSLWPCIFLHFVNNALGVAGAVFAVDDADLPMAAVAVATGVSLGLCALLPVGSRGETAA